MKRINRWITVVLAASMLLASSFLANAAGPRVVPLKLDDCGFAAHWAATYACDLQHQGVLTANANVSFDETITRGYFANLLMMANGSLAADPRAKEPLTRQEAFVLLANAVGGQAVAGADLKVLAKYPDAEAMTAEGKQALAFLMLNGVVQGKLGGKISPQENLTLGEAVKLIATAVPEKLPAGTEKISVVLYNDLHGHLVQDAQKRANYDLGVSVLTTAMNGQLLKNPNTVLIDGGDTYQGTPISNLSAGEASLDWRNNVGVKVAAIGNHEFDWKIPTLEKLIAGSKAPMITANIFNKGTDTRPDWATPTHVLEVAGYKIGIIGITTPATAGIVLPSIVENLEFRDPAVVINAEAKKLRAEGADLVFVVTHGAASQGAPDDPFKVSDEVAIWIKGVTEKVDLVTAAHSHLRVAGYALDAQGNQVPVVQAGSYGQALARIDLYIEKVTGEVTKAVPAVWTPSPTLAPTPWAEALVAKWQAAVKPIETRPVGKLTAKISRTPTEAGEMPLGDFIADGMLTAAPGVTIAIMNGGGIRADLEGDPATGEVNFGHMFTVQPFGNTIVTVDMTGAQLKLVLEQGLISYVKMIENKPGSHRPMQVAGISFKWDYAKADGERILELNLANGQPVDPNATYKVAVNNFMAGGGDDLPILKELQVAGKQVDTGVVDVEVTVEHFKTVTAGGPLTYGLQNRISVVNFPKK
ncbi:MAG: 5-nucleotidase [Symbiobacteriaceae bacterium]|nr:5-nucleotidase [Symbiobacteriaceae bacterium]